MESFDRKDFLKKIFKIGIIYYILFLFSLTYFYAYKTNFHHSLGGIRINNFKIYSPISYFKWRKINKNKTPNLIKKCNTYLTLSPYIYLVLVLISAKKKQIETVHGSASWAEKKDIDKMDLYRDTGAVLGKDERNRLLHDNSDRHIFVAAPTRGGKGINTVTPTSLDWTKSIVFNDIKGELWDLTSGYRKKVLKQKVFMFCATDTEGISCSYNPLDFIAIGTGHEFEDVSVISQTLIDTEGKGESDHWITSAINLLNGVILHVKYAKKNASLIDVAKFLSPADTSLSNVLADILGVPREDEEDETGVALRSAAKIGLTIDADDIDVNEKGEATYPTKGKAAFNHLEHFENKNLFKEIYGYEGTELDTECTLHPLVSKEFMSLFSTPDKERGSIISTANQKLKIFLDPIIASHITHSDFTIKELMRDKCSLYLVTPPKSIARTRPILRLIFVQIVYGLTDRMKFNHSTDNETQSSSFIGKQINLLTKGTKKIINNVTDYFYPKVKKEKNQILLLIDEFPSLGKMEIIENAMSFIAGYGLKCLLISQSLKQFKKIYGKENYILDNCSIQLYFTPNDEETPKMISDMFDSYTKKVYNETRKGFELMPSRSSSYVARKLMTAGEVRSLPYEKILLMITGQKPIKGNKLFYFREDRYKKKLLPPPLKSDFKERELDIDEKTEIVTNSFTPVVDISQPIKIGIFELIQSEPVRPEIEDEIIEKEKNELIFKINSFQNSKDIERDYVRNTIEATIEKNKIDTKDRIFKEVER
ncbi:MULTISPECIES: type IV secretory system conjugative DNA transfer family protein [unclassified Fusobacterium]|uniref:type IV secretory system conjugative DNA transfer family protein n=1 Tax=unclassified Fusobacterium TaxID=2648384 RepID=UPI001B8B1D6F|nr:MULTISPECIES: type IV secretory system conjugative DNA transfer family protein [unclassified Fusobacterium]MBR8700492.1 Conjugal transfer protein TraG [Fusobacterium sp. DD45]MBR8710243.1 Conjugal transfer protein TraG [Fusobacterium sp. DD28]MBR8750765.1 Conjugal transfer protein TraG [Fusobacterium sp. DD26]